MSNMFRYICIGLGVVLIGMGWLGISSETVQQDAVNRVGSLAAGYFMGQHAPGGSALQKQFADPRAREALAAAGIDPEEVLGRTASTAPVSRRQILVEAANTTYARAVLAVLLGAALCGIGIPFGRFTRQSETSRTLLKQPAALLLMLAALFTISGLAVAAAHGFENGWSFPGSRSALVLVVCGLLALCLGWVKPVGYVGYGTGLLLTLLIGANFARMGLLKGQLSLAAFDTQRWFITGLAALSILTFALLWRAYPGGLDRARFVLQCRRVAASVGIAAVFAGVCVFKSTVLPQQALAGLQAPGGSPLLDDPVVQSALADPRVQSLLEDPGAKEKLTAMGFSEELVDFGLEQLAEVRKQASDSASVPPPTSEGPSPQPVPSGTEAPKTAAALDRVVASLNANDGEGTLTDPVALLQSLSNAELQQLLGAAGVQADLSDPRVQEKINAYRQQIDPNDPRIQEAMAKLSAQNKGKGAPGTDALQQLVKEAASNPPASTPKQQGADPTWEDEAKDDNLPRTVFGLPTAVQTKAAGTKVSTRANELRQTHKRSSPPPPPAVPSRFAGSSEHADEPEASGASSAAADDGTDAASVAQVTEPDGAAGLASTTADVTGTTADRIEATLTDPGVESDEPKTTDSTPAVLEPAIDESSPPTAEAESPALDCPPPDPPRAENPVDRLTRSAMQQATGIGLVTMVGGAFVFVLAIVIRGSKQ